MVLDNGFVGTICCKSFAIGVLCSLEKKRMSLFTGSTAGTTRHFDNWRKWLARFQGRPVTAMEIGVYEGCATCWFLDNILTDPASRMVCVDTFDGGLDHKRAGVDFSGVEARFRDNIRPYGAKVTTVKSTSHDCLRDFHRTVGDLSFDFIYIDGSHEAPDVLADAVLAWPLVKAGGAVIFDDYKWKSGLGKRHDPKLAVDSFIACYAEQLRVVDKGWQLCVEKL